MLEHSLTEIEQGYMNVPGRYYGGAMPKVGNFSIGESCTAIGLLKTPISLEYFCYFKL